MERSVCRFKVLDVLQRKGKRVGWRCNGMRFDGLITSQSGDSRYWHGEWKPQNDPHPTISRSPLRIRMKNISARNW